MPVQRSPNLPALNTSTRSPGDVMFATDASMMPLPEQAIRITSFLVPMNVRSCSSTRTYCARNSGVRWCRSAAAMANCAAGSKGVGPGVKRRVFRIMSVWVPCFLFYPARRSLYWCVGLVSARQETNAHDPSGADSAGHHCSHERARAVEARCAAHGQERDQEQRD